MDGGVYLIGMGGLVSVLLSLSAYLLRYLVQDLRELKEQVAETRRGVTRLQAEQKVLRAMVQTQLTVLRNRLQLLEKAG
jgi:cell division protein FtsB